MAQMIILIFLSCVAISDAARLKQRVSNFQSESAHDSNHSSGGKTCNVVEVEGRGRVQYGISFSQEKVGGGCDPIKCSGVFFLSEVVPSLFKIEPNAEDEDESTCHCTSADLRGRSDGDTWQFDFFVVPSMPNRKECSPVVCWTLYADVLYLAHKEAKPQDNPASPNHWNVGCVDKSEAAQSHGLKSVGSVVELLTSGDSADKRAARKIKRMINVRKASTPKFIRDSQIVSMESPVQHVSIVKVSDERLEVERSRMMSNDINLEALRIAGEMLLNDDRGKLPSKEELVQENVERLKREREAHDLVETVGANVLERENLESDKAVLRDVVVIERPGKYCSAATSSVENTRCMNIQDRGDCGRAGELAGINQIGDLHVFNGPKSDYPGYCSVRVMPDKRDYTMKYHVWWNPSTNEVPAKKIPSNKKGGGSGNVGWYLLCGCYEDLPPAIATIDEIKEAVEHVVEFDPVIVETSLKTSSVEDRQKQDEEIIIPDSTDLPGNQPGIITNIDEPETVDLSLLPPGTEQGSKLANCMAKSDWWGQAACFCSSANDPEYDGDQCTAMNKLVLGIAKATDQEQWNCVRKTVKVSRNSKRKIPKCMAELSWGR